MNEVNIKELKRMSPFLRKLSDGRWEASVGTGFETCWWPEGIGRTPKEAISRLRKILARL